MTQHKQTISLAIAFSVALSGVQGEAQIGPVDSGPTSSIIFNAPPPPADIGQPGRRSDAGSRGCSEEESNSSAPTSLLALVPVQETADSSVVFGKTASEYPTFWFYVPDRSSSTAVFVLQNRDGYSVYESQVTLPEAGGVISVELPTTVPPLELNQVYQWFFKLYCRSSSPPDSFVSGWVQRESLPSDVTQQLQSAPLQQQSQLYAETGFWFDALTTAAQLQADPTNPTWTELLRTAGLESVATEAIATP